MKLGTEGTIENDSVKSYDALTAENQALQSKLAEAVVIIKEQKDMLNQIGQEIKDGKLIYRSTEGAG